MICLSVQVPGTGVGPESVLRRQERKGAWSMVGEFLGILLGGEGIRSLL